MTSPSEGSLSSGHQAQPQTQNTNGDAGTAAAAAPSREKPPIPDNASVPKPKRLACMICRKRKLKCDGVRPSCSTCSRLGHVCAYDEQRRKSGPKRGYVKALEERLKQVETLLKTQDQPSANNASPPVKNMGALPLRAGSTQQPTIPPAGNGGPLSLGDWDMDRRNFNNGESPQQAAPMDDLNFQANIGMGMNNVSSDFTWEMIGLGLEEPLPAQETIDELHQIYFEKVHPSMPMIHKYRYLAAMNLAPNQRPPVCLRYAMWTMACSVTDKYADMKDLFYNRARKYIESDYIKGYGEQMISVAHCQTHILLSFYEMKMMYFPRAWVNTGSAVRLAQMTGLHRLDGSGLDVKQCIPPPKDWTEREERRRTFWMAFCEDRYASIGTGWPMVVDERDVLTDLPASEEAFDMSRPEQTQSLADATRPPGASKLSSFGSVVLMACLFGRNLVHLHRPDPDDQDDDLNGPFWKRHRHLDNIILNTSLCLPSHLKLPAGMSNPNVVFSNMSIHTSTICLHQAAIFKAEKNRLPSTVGAESKVRCITAANEIASMMRTVSHMDLASMNPFISFCLYVSARVFVQYLKSRPEDGQTADSLQFLLSAMNALKRRNPLTESFLVQLDVDLEALSLRIPELRNAFARAQSPGPPTGGSRCIPVCDNPDGVHGILAYRNETSFMKDGMEDGNAANGQPEMAQPQNDMSNLDTSNSTGFTSQPWLSAEQSMSGLTPSSGGMYDKGGLGTGDNQGTSKASPDGVPSSCLTPNSSSNGGRGDSGAERGRLAPGQMNGSGLNSFQASPISPQQNLMGQQGDMRGGGGGGNDSTNSFFGDPGGFSVSPTMNEQQHGGSMFGVAGGPGPWGNIQSQQGMQQVGDGVLRALMNMGPMDAMDLSSWDQGNENMRQ